MNKNSNSPTKHQQTEKINFSDSFFFNLKVFNNSSELFRVYDPILLEKLKIQDDEVFISELTVFFKYMNSIDMKIVYIKSKPNNKILLNTEDLCGFSDLKNKQTDNWVEIQELQAFDLGFLFKQFFFQSLIIIPRISNNCYHFDLLLAFESSFDLNLLNHLIFKSSLLGKPKLIETQEITFSFFRRLFNFNDIYKYTFKTNNTLEWEKVFKTLCDKELTAKMHESVEFKNFNQFVKKQSEFFNIPEEILQKDPKSDYWYFYNLKENRDFKIFYENYNVFLNNYFYQLGVNWYCVNFEWSDQYDFTSMSNSTFPVNESFYFKEGLNIDLDLYKKNLIPNTNNVDFNIEFDCFDRSCMQDYIYCIHHPNNESRCINFYNINVNIIKFGTNYKTFLNQKKYY